MKYKNNSFKIAFMGMMLSLVLIFQYLEEFWDLKMGFVKLNISIIFILSISFIIGKKWAFALIVLRFAIGPSVSSLLYTLEGIWSQFALVIYDGLFLTIVYLLVKMFKNIYVAISLGTISIIVLAPLLNGLLITPVFWYLLDYQKTIYFYDSFKVYQNIKTFFFNIPNYWGGVYATYMLANLIKFSIISISFLALWRVIEVYYYHKPIFLKNKYINPKIKYKSKNKI